MAYKGIDVSKHQGIINWTKVKNAEVSFVFLRMGYGTITDPMFIQNYNKAKSAGIIIGGYWFSYALTVNEAKTQANTCLALLKSYPMQLPIFYDFEDDTQRYANQKGVFYTRTSRTNIIKTFCTTLKAKGYKTGIYTNPNYIVNFLNWSELKSQPLWIAKWVKYNGAATTDFSISPDLAPKNYGTPTIWQFSRTGKIDGINGDVDLNYWYDALPITTTATVKKTYPNKYTVNDLTIRKLNNFKIIYLDSKKSGLNYSCYINAGFFGNYNTESGKLFTLPSANLVCEVKDIPVEGYPYVRGKITNQKLYWSCADNHSSQFKGKKVSTLIIPKIGNPYIEDTSAPPQDCLYAISGVPTVRNKDDVDYYNYVKKQGWDQSCMGAAYRNWIGVRDGELWLISGRTTAKNYIYGMEFWKKIKNEQFDDIIALDGGGSYIYKDSAYIKKTANNRRINNIITFT